MKLSETPIAPGKLIGLRELKGGHKGVLFLLENDGGEKLVVKFQNEPPTEALAGTRIMKVAGGSTPGVRLASRIDVGILLHAVANIAFELAPLRKAFESAKSSFKHVLLMEFAEGATLKAKREDAVDEFLAIIQDQSFQIALGKVIAADAFAGNPDRMFAGKIGFDPKLAGWYHEQNLFMAKSSDGSPNAVAIDNAFQPHVFDATAPWGRYLGGMGVQWGSLAAGNVELAKHEAGLLFDLFLSTAKNDHPDAEPQIEQARSGRLTFQTNVARGAQEAMQALLARGQGWKDKLRKDGATEDTIRSFRIRKRLLRLMAEGEGTEEATQEAIKDARDDQAYRKWVLVNEYHMASDAADALLLQSLAAYKDFKRRSRHV